jgi:hypothetical protein
MQSKIKHHKYLSVKEDVNTGTLCRAVFEYHIYIEDTT